jgi:hypothetical protein
VGLVPTLLALLVLVLVVVAVDYLSGATADAGPPGRAPSPSPSRSAGSIPPTPAPHRSPGAALAVGRGPQQTYSVHRDAAPGSCHYRYEQGRPLPDPHCTPGALSPAVTAATLDRTVCAPGGYTKGVRPPVTVTDREKRLSATAYGYRGPAATGEYDHLVPLSLGGDPNDVRNLWLEPNDKKGATSTTNGKDAVEDTLHAAVCGRRVPLADAQRAIAADWVTALAVLGLG